MIELNKLAQEIYAAAVEKGFWAVDEAMEKHIAKMHSELSEALNEDRMDRPMLYVDDIQALDRITDPAQFDGRKPEGIAAELADFVMMLLDLCARIGHELPNGPVSDWIEEEIDEGYLNGTGTWNVVCALHGLLCNITDGEDEDGIIIAITLVHEWLRVRGIDLWQVIRLKMEYNRARPPLHGRKY